MVGTARSIEITKVSYHAWQLKSRVPMLPLVRCATISRQLGQGRQRSGGSPLFMINHRSSHIIGSTTVLPDYGVAIRPTRRANRRARATSAGPTRHACACTRGNQ